MGKGKSNKDDGKNDPKAVKKPWLFRSLEGKGNHILSGTETTDKDGKKHIKLEKTKPGNSNN